MRWKNLEGRSAVESLEESLQKDRMNGEEKDVIKKFVRKFSMSTSGRGVR